MTKLIMSLGCEVRLSDCFITKIEKVKNCDCFEAYPEDIKAALRKRPKIYCPSCQAPVDVEVKKNVLKFFSPLRDEAEQAPEIYWPSFLNKITAKANDNTKGVRAFPLFSEKGLRRDVVVVGVPVWSQTGAYNGELPVPPSTKKFDEIKSVLAELGIFNKDSYKARLFFADDPDSQKVAAPIKVDETTKPEPLAPKTVEVVESKPAIHKPGGARPVIKGGVDLGYEIRE